MRTLASLAVWAVVAGCGDEGPALTDAAVPAHDATVDADVETCRLEAVVARHLDGSTPQDCGRLLPDDEDTLFDGARGCVLQAVAAEQDFVVFVDRTSIDSRFALAYLGVHRGGLWTVEMFDYDGDPGGGGFETAPLTWVFTCADLVEDEVCASGIRPGLCVTCERRASVERCPP